jgi:YHS domain-containing protein
MMRGIIYLLVSILVVTFIRFVLVMIRNGFQDLMKSEQAPPTASAKAPPPAAGGGHLVRDPVCGTYVSEGSPHRKSVNGQQYAYCSSDCRDKHLA